jgi:hypothetical protein
MAISDAERISVDEGKVMNKTEYTLVHKVSHEQAHEIALVAAKSAAELVAKGMDSPESIAEAYKATYVSCFGWFAELSTSPGRTVTEFMMGARDD